MDVGDSPLVVELDDPPTGHYGRNDIEDASNSTSGRRRLSKGRSATSSHRHLLRLPGDSRFDGGGGGGGSGGESGGESDGGTGTFSAALVPDDGALNGDDNDNDDRGRGIGRGRGGASGPAQSKKVSRLARKAVRPTVHNENNDFEPASLSSNSEVSGGEDEPEPGQSLSAVAFFGWRRDHSAPPCSRSPPAIDRLTPPRPGSAAAAVGRVGSVGEETAPKGVSIGKGGGAAAAVAAAMAYSRSLSSSAHAGDDSTSSATEGFYHSGVHSSSQGAGTGSSVGAPSDLILADAEVGTAVAQMREGLDLAAEDNRSVGQSSAAAPGIAPGSRRHKTRRHVSDGRRERGQDGYVSAPDVSRGRRGDGVSGRPSETDERIVRSRTVLFAADSTEGSEMGGANRPRRVDEGEGAAATISGDGSDDDANLPANSATPTLKQSPSLVSGRGGSTTSSTRRKLAGLLHFRRRRGVGDMGASGSTGSPPDLPSVDAARIDADTAVTAAATAAGALDDRERVSRGAGHRGRSSLRRSSSTSSLGVRSLALAADDDDHAQAAEGSSDDGVNEPAVTARRGGGGVSGDIDGNSSGVTRGRSARRRLLPSRSSQNPSAGASASLEPKRCTGSFLEAGKHKLRRGRNKLSRSSFGGGESSRRSRSMVPVKTSRDTRGAENEEADEVDDDEPKPHGEGVHSMAEDSDTKPPMPELKGAYVGILVEGFVTLWLVFVVAVDPVTTG